jgi:hypothetical protein
VCTFICLSILLEAISTNIFGSNICFNPIQSNLPLEGTCIQSNLPLEGTCIQSNLLLEGTCIQSNLPLEGTCIQSNLPLEGNCIQSNMSIKGTQGNLKMCPLWAVALYIQVKINALYINEKNEAVLYREWFVI